MPDYRLFFRGDEIEIHRRLVRTGLPFGTSLQGGLRAPGGLGRVQADARRPAVHAQYPENEIKRYFTYRNRGYLLSQPGMRKLGALELFRFGLYFLAVKKDPKAFVEWLKLVRLGQRERFFRK